MRISKDYEERKAEILQVAGDLFETKGYSKCTINDILSGVGISKGTFYYYFNSKEEVLDEIIENVSNIVFDRIKRVVDSKELTPEIKFINAFKAMRVEKEVDKNIMSELHKAENALMHQKSLKVIIEKTTPLLVQIVEEGSAKGVFDCDRPTEYMQIFMAAALTLTDEGIFEIEPEEQLNMINALVSVLEKMLNVKSGSLIDKLEEYFKE